MTTSDKQQTSPKRWQKVSILAAAASQLGAVLGGSAFLGALADEKFGTSPWLFLILLTTGFVGGFWNLLQILKRYGSGSNNAAGGDQTDGRD